MKLITLFLALSILTGCSETNSSVDALPETLAKRIPKGYQSAAFRSMDFNGDGVKDFVVIATSMKEKESTALTGQDSPKRLVLVYFGTRAANELSYQLVAQNDSVALPANGGGMAAPCDPLFDQGDGLAVKDAYFTVENQVACGAHWSDFITFKYSASAKGMVFHNRILESSGLSDKTGEFGVTQRKVEKAGTKAVLLQDYKAY